MTQNYRTYTPKLVPKAEYFSPGHRACTGCGEALAVRLVCKALGENTIISNATGCMEVISSQLPYTAWSIPWIHTLFENTASVASGIEAALKAMERKGLRPKRNTKVVAMAGDGGTYDIGFQSLSGALERGHDFLYVCFNNEAYMNTGIQRSSATPYGAATTTSPVGKIKAGQVTWKKNLPAIVAAHDIPYMATACPSYPFDLMKKIKKGVDTPGSAYVEVFSVCPIGWRSAPALSVKIGRLAVRTGVFPLYEVEKGQYKLSYDFPKLTSVTDYLKLQGRFKHLSEDELNKIQSRVDEEYNKLRERAGILT
jgi:pyruvate ferredoxin oxidoreductase beta subunit